MPFVPDSASEKKRRFVPDTGAASPEPDEAPQRARGDMSGEPIAGALEPLLTMATGAVAKPLSDIAGLGAIPLHALGITQTDPTEVKNIVQSGMTYQPRTEMGKAMNLIPEAIGRGIDWASTGVGNLAAKAVPDTSPNIQDAIRNATKEAANQSLMFLGGPGGRAAQAGLQGEGWGARGFIRSALKPDLEARRTGKADRAISTILEDKLNVSRAGMDKAENLTEAPMGTVNEMVADSSAMADKGNLVSGLADMYEQAKHQGIPQGDLAVIARNIRRVENHPLLPKITPAQPARTVESAILDERGNPFTTEIPEVPASGTNQFPVQLAQDLKQGTYKSLGDKAYGELKVTDKESQKLVARLLKEDIEAGVPGVDVPNARVSDLLNAKKQIEKRVGTAGNAGHVTFGALTHSLPALVTWLADRGIASQSVIAHLLNAAGRGAGAAGEASPAIGAMSTFEADQAARKKRLAQLLGSQ